MKSYSKALNHPKSKSVPNKIKGLNYCPILSPHDLNKCPVQKSPIPPSQGPPPGHGATGESRHPPPGRWRKTSGCSTPPLLQSWPKKCHQIDGWRINRTAGDVEILYGDILGHLWGRFGTTPRCGRASAFSAESSEQRLGIRQRS